MNAIDDPQSILDANGVLPLSESGERFGAMATQALAYQRAQINPGDVVTWQVRGTLLRHTFRNGDIVLIDLGDTQLRCSCFYAVLIHGELVVKKIVRQLNLLRFCSEDPSFPPIDTAADDPDPCVTPVGRVVAIFRMIEMMS